MLAKENARRENEPHDDTYDDVYVTRENADGTRVEQKVDKVRLFTSFRLAGLCD